MDSLFKWWLKVNEARSGVFQIGYLKLFLA